MKYVAYLRVSTDKQGHSGLGLDAQQAAITRFLNKNDQLVGQFLEVESGKNHSDRPKLADALRVCRMKGATLLVAKLDRLSRNLAFIATLMESKTPFVACDMPNADPLRLHIEAAVAEDERRRISERTKAALAAAKTRGVRLGGHRPGSGMHRPEAKAKAVETLRRKREAFIRDVLPTIRGLQQEGITSLAGLSVELNRRGVRGQRGSRWYPETVKRVLDRANDFTIVNAR